MISAQKNDRMRVKLMMRPTMEEAKKLLEEDPFGAESWYAYGVAVGYEKGPEEAVDAFSEGLIHNPFDADLYFGRGRKQNNAGRFRSALSDFTMSIRLEPYAWCHWYYRATTYNLNGFYKESIDDFMSCLKYSEEYERCPMVHWIYTTALDTGEREKAEEALGWFGDDVKPPQMDYGYHRCVLLYKGILTPETFVDIPDMEKNCLKQPDRINLELNTMYSGPYPFHMFRGPEQEADDARRKLREIAIPNSFGYMRGSVAAKKRGLLK